MNPCRVDLHTHTICSDGQLTPAALVQKAAAAGLKALAVTDHDTVGGVAAAQAAGAACGIEIVTGIELSTVVEDEEVHLLGYFFEAADAALREALQRLAAGRARRAEQIVEKLNDHGVPLTLEAVRQQAGRGVLGRPHVAAALVAGGHVASQDEAFERYLGKNKLAYVAKPPFPAAEALALLHAAGGIGVLAHPGHWTATSVLRQLVRDGLDGIEVIHPSHDDTLVQYYQQVAQHFDLIETGGSDYHGHRSHEEEHFGRFGISEAQLERVRRAACLDVAR